jgi:hypothetical protein
MERHYRAAHPSYDFAGMLAGERKREARREERERARREQRAARELPGRLAGYIEQVRRLEARAAEAEGLREQLAEERGLRAAADSLVDCLLRRVFLH